MSWSWENSQENWSCEYWSCESWFRENWSQEMTPMRVRLSANCEHWLASFLRPTQLSVACSTVKWVSFLMWAWCKRQNFLNKGQLTVGNKGVYATALHLSLLVLCSVFLTSVACYIPFLKVKSVSYFVPTLYNESFRGLFVQLFASVWIYIVSQTPLLFKTACTIQTTCICIIEVHKNACLELFFSGYTCTLALWIIGCMHWGRAVYNHRTLD